MLSIRVQLKVLMDQREFIEAEMCTLVDSVPKSEALIDSDGFPRNDIDVRQVAINRSKHTQLRNDLAVLMEKIETKLHELHQLAPEHKDKRVCLSSDSKVYNPSLHISPIADEVKPVAVSPPERIAFVIDSVFVGGPAEAAGLINGDSVVQFHDLTSFEPRRLQEIVNEIPIIAIRVQRPGVDECLSLELRPEAWNGPGKLGCHIIPFQLD